MAQVSERTKNLIRNCIKAKGAQTTRQIADWTGLSVATVLRGLSDARAYPVHYEGQKPYWGLAGPEATKRDATAKALLDWLRPRKKWGLTLLSAKQLAQATGLSDRHVREALNQLEIEGKVKATGSSNGRLWSLV